MQANKSYDSMRTKAIKKGWVVDGDRTFSKATWMRYWKEMEAYGKGLLEGHPIPPPSLRIKKPRQTREGICQGKPGRRLPGDSVAMSSFFASGR